MAKTVKEPAAEAPTKAPAKSPAKKADRKAAERVPSGPQVALQVRYRSTMRPGRVFPLTVEVPKSKEPREAPIAVVRVHVPGALVSPTEQRLDLAKSGDKAVFYVTPLAKGRLPAARVEVFTPGQATQEMRLGMRAATQCWAKWLLAATIVLPILIGGLVSGPWQLPTYRVTPVVDSALMKQLAGIPLLSEPWEKAPEFVRDYVKDVVLVHDVARWLGIGYSWFAEWVEKGRGLAWIALALFLLTLIAWFRNRTWGGRRRLMVPLPDREASNNVAPRTLEPMA